MDIASIQRRVDDAVHFSTIEIGYQGGPDAVDAFLRQHLCEFVALAHSELGADGARMLMTQGLKVAEALVEKGA